jgi:ElaB/YqjD/DUF883 family membrane-anchored ribosome-binding protein
MMERTAAESAALVDELQNVVAHAETLLRRFSVEGQAYVRENPWTVVGSAVATGLLLGVAFTASLRSLNR